MGMFKKPSMTTSYKVDPVNPNPHKFTIKRTQNINGLWITMVNYPNCTNFEGNKILVTTFDVKNKDFLDPHFNTDGGLVARFQPTKLGWELAVNFVKSLS